MDTLAPGLWLPGANPARPDRVKPREGLAEKAITFEIRVKPYVKMFISASEDSMHALHPKVLDEWVRSNRLLQVLQGYPLEH
jgi:hypothetical protein